MAAKRPDHWTSKAYTTSAPFVPRLTSTVLSYLSPKPTDHILDLGCGDGVLTSQLASSVPSGRVLGLDASPSMIETARSSYLAHHPNLEFRIQDCTRLVEALASHPELDGQWDKVFSNAALHWIMRAPATRESVLAAAYAALKRGGTFVFEMGGAGNVAEVHTALIAALVAQGVPVLEAREASPWFFPSEDWMRTELEKVGFTVEKCEVEYRPTRMTDEKGGGLAGWVRLMGAEFLEKVEEERSEEAVGFVCELLESVVTREEDGSVWIGYVRLRAVAKKL
ncbi:hypothetical protein K402DRAFT_261425 [Aulographum hederae CBS 113979]|uniref:Methyltransferase domain-containing protein n=1 Tax=Aulographum hederae CBS 113979 TaxID=1176131 RepID=A0A6G1H9F3_9PEZI|nr:hypothetical protein K402DRAFT_261425 [Aulographum hederae CBS 113979]